MDSSLHHRIHQKFSTGASIFRRPSIALKAEPPMELSHDGNSTTTDHVAAATNTKKSFGFHFHDSDDEEDDLKSEGGRSTKSRNHAVPRLSELLTNLMSSPKDTDSTGSSDTPNTTTSIRKHFQHMRSPSFSLTGLTQHAQEFSEDMMSLAQTISDRRKELVQEIITEKGDTIVKIRFVAAIDQYENCPDKEEKKHLGQRLVEIFVPTPVTTATQEFGHKLAEFFHPQPMSREAAQSTVTIEDAPTKMFVIHSLSEETTRRLNNGYLSHLADARREVLHELTQNKTLMQAVDNIKSGIKW